MEINPSPKVTDTVQLYLLAVFWYSELYWQIPWLCTLSFYNSGVRYLQGVDVTVSEWLCVLWGHRTEGFHTGEISVNLQGVGEDAVAGCSNASRSLVLESCT